MANLNEIEAAVVAMEMAGLPRHQVIILHCTSQYPADFKNINLRAIDLLVKHFGMRVGYLTILWH